jgi:hypothetical protein
MSKPVELREHTHISRPRRIDEDAGVLYDLAILGPESLNGRSYLESAMRGALPLFEGRQSFVNHTKGGGEPSTYDVLGVWRDCYVDDGYTYGNVDHRARQLRPARRQGDRREPEQGR